MRKSQYATLIAVVIVAALLVGIVGYFALGNKQLVDFNQRFNYAYVCWPNGACRKVKLISWKDFEGEQIQITTEEGTYVFHSSNCVLAYEKEK